MPLLQRRNRSRRRDLQTLPFYYQRPPEEKKESTILVYCIHAWGLHRNSIFRNPCLSFLSNILIIIPQIFLRAVRNPFLTEFHHFRPKVVWNHFSSIWNRKYFFPFPSNHNMYDSGALSICSWQSPSCTAPSPHSLFEPISKSICPELISPAGNRQIASSCYHRYFWI